MSPPLPLPELPNPIQMMGLDKTNEPCFWYSAPQIDIIRKTFFRKTNFQSMFRLLQKWSILFFLFYFFILYFYCHQTERESSYKKPSEMHFPVFGWSLLPRSLYRIRVKHAKCHMGNFVKPLIKMLVFRVLDAKRLHIQCRLHELPDFSPSICPVFIYAAVFSLALSLWFSLFE